MVCGAVGGGVDREQGRQTDGQTCVYAGDEGSGGPRCRSAQDRTFVYDDYVECRVQDQSEGASRVYMRGGDACED